MQFTVFAPLANMDNYDANVQIYYYCSEANTSKLHAKVLFWFPGETRANTTAK